MSTHTLSRSIPSARGSLPLRLRKGELYAVFWMLSVCPSKQPELRIRSTSRRRYKDSFIEFRNALGARRTKVDPDSSGPLDFCITLCISVTPLLHFCRHALENVSCRHSLHVSSYRAYGCTFTNEPSLSNGSGQVFSFGVIPSSYQIANVFAKSRHMGKLGCMEQPMQSINSIESDAVGFSPSFPDAFAREFPTSLDTICSPFISTSR